MLDTRIIQWENKIPYIKNLTSGRQRRWWFLFSCIDYHLSFVGALINYTTVLIHALINLKQFRQLQNV